jgi:ADP-ribosylglycohydrolase
VVYEPDRKGQVEAEIRDWRLRDTKDATIGGNNELTSPTEQSRIEVKRDGVECRECGWQARTCGGFHRGSLVEVMHRGLTSGQEVAVWEAG